jgi:hypothetical protein
LKDYDEASCGVEKLSMLAPLPNERIKSSSNITL